MIWLFGGIESVRIIHRAAAVVLMLETIYHGGVVTYKVLVKRVALTMMPGWQDIKDGFQALGYNMWLAKTPPPANLLSSGCGDLWPIIAWALLVRNL